MRVARLPRQRLQVWMPSSYASENYRAFEIHRSEHRRIDRQLQPWRNWEASQPRMPARRGDEALRRVARGMAQSNSKACDDVMKAAMGSWLIYSISMHGKR